MNNISPSNTNSLTTVLVSGGSIAGPTVAYWLNQYGFKVTLVERNNGTRTGGQAIDIRAVALEVVEKMGVLDEIKARRTDFRGASAVDVNGDEISRSTEITFSGGVIANDDLEILRDELGDIFYEATQADVEYLFGDSVESLTETADGVEITFEKNEPRTFDLVIGADGLHSRVRNLAFGPESNYVVPVQLDPGVTRFMAIFSAPNLLNLDHWQVARNTEKGICFLYVAKENTVSRAMMGMGATELDYDYRDKEAQKQIVADYYATDQNWIIPELLENMWKADDFYFDSMSQTRMDAWSKGRVALVGDAAFCPSAMSGQGTSVALVGAYVLAGELAAANGDFRTAFENYEAQIRPFVEKNQELPYMGRDNEFEDANDIERVASRTESLSFLEIVNGYTFKDYSAFLPQPAKV